MLAISAMNEIIGKAQDRSTGELLDLLRERIINDLTKNDETAKDGLDISLCKYLPDERQLEYSGANNNLWIIEPNTSRDSNSDKPYVSDFVLNEISGDRMPIGHYFKVNVPFTTHKINLKEGSQVVLYTDGFADQFGGAENKKYKYSKMKNYFLQCKTENSERITSTEIDKEFKSWKGSFEQTDDVCILLIDL